MYRIPTETLWLGNLGDVLDLRAVYDADIIALVDLAVNEPPARISREMVYCRIPLVDGAGNPSGLLRAAVDLTVSLLRSRTPTLLYCSAGMSRTPAVAAVALSILRDRDPVQCLQDLTRDRPHDVSPGLWRDLLGVAHGSFRAGPSSVN